MKYEVKRENGEAEAV